MLQITLARSVDEAYRAIKDAAPLWEVLDAFDALFSQLQAHLLGISEGGEKLPSNSSEIHGKLASFSNTLRRFNARKIFKGIENLQLCLSASLGRAEEVGDHKFVTELLQILEEFSDGYNEYVAYQSGAHALPLLIRANRLRILLITLQNFLLYLKETYSGTAQMIDGEAVFSMVLPHVTNVQDFATRLAALQALYDELCYMLGVSTASHPLRIGKIESGSLFTQLFGDTRVIGLMVSMLERAVSYFHRNYTTEGKIAAIPTKVEALEKIFGLSEKMRQSGADVTKLQESLAKNAVTIADALNVLVSDQAAVEINGKTLSVGAELEKALLEQRSALQLPLSSPPSTLPRLAPPEPNSDKADQ